MIVLHAVSYYHTAYNSPKLPFVGSTFLGNYWPRIYQLFKDEKIGIPIEGGEFHITHGYLLNPIYEDCIHALEELERMEADRRLDRASKYAGIKYARFAFVVSLIALAVSLASLVWQIIG